MHFKSHLKSEPGGYSGMGRRLGHGNRLCGRAGACVGKCGEAQSGTAENASGSDGGRNEADEVTRHGCVHFEFSFASWVLGFVRTGVDHGPLCVNLSQRRSYGSVLTASRLCSQPAQCAIFSFCALRSHTNGRRTHPARVWQKWCGDRDDRGETVGTSAATGRHSEIHSSNRSVCSNGPLSLRFLGRRRLGARLVGSTRRFLPAGFPASSAQPPRGPHYVPLVRPAASPCGGWVRGGIRA